MKKNKNTEVQLIGLTGQTGAGKSTVTACFKEKGFAVIDCDTVTREVQSRPEVLKMLEANYGSQILQPNGSLNRKMLAAIAFSELKQTEKLNRLMFPPIREEIDRLIAGYKADGKKFILLDAPTLFESGIDKICTRKIAVLANEEVRLQRILMRDALSEEEARRRISAQHPDAYYTVRSDFVLRNNGTKEELLRDGKALADELTRPNQDGKTALVTLVSIVAVIAVIMSLYTFTYRHLYSREYPETVAAFSEESGLDENLCYALHYCDPETSEEAFAEKLRTIPAGADMRTAAAVYYAGGQTASKWLHDPAYSSDGIHLSTIPDTEADSFADQVEDAYRIYKNLYDK